MKYNRERIYAILGKHYPLGVLESLSDIVMDAVEHATAEGLYAYIIPGDDESTIGDSNFWIPVMDDDEIEEQISGYGKYIAVYSKRDVKIILK